VKSEAFGQLETHTTAIGRRKKKRREENGVRWVDERG
jgi:hypothetical protein